MKKRRKNHRSAKQLRPHQIDQQSGVLIAAMAGAAVALWAMEMASRLQAVQSATKAEAKQRRARNVIDGRRPKTRAELDAMEARQASGKRKYTRSKAFWEAAERRKAKRVKLTGAAKQEPTAATKTLALAHPAPARQLCGASREVNGRSYVCQLQAGDAHRHVYLTPAGGWKKTA